MVVSWIFSWSPEHPGLTYNVLQISANNLSTDANLNNPESQSLDSPFVLREFPVLNLREFPAANNQLHRSSSKCTQITEPACKETTLYQGTVCKGNSLVTSVLLAALSLIRLKVFLASPVISVSCATCTSTSKRKPNPTKHPNRL